MHQNNNKTGTFSGYARLLHWSAALLVFGLFALGLWMRSLNYYHPWYNTAPQLHTSFGIVFIVLVFLRLFWRATTTPPPPLGENRLEHALAAIVHAFLYGLLIALAITGYLYASADGKASSIFGIVELPVLIRSKALADQVGDLHEWFAYAIIAIAALHVIGALKHHVIDHDDTLRRMTSGAHEQAKSGSNSDDI